MLINVVKCLNDLKSIYSYKLLYVCTYASVTIGYNLLIEAICVTMTMTTCACSATLSSSSSSSRTFCIKFRPMHGLGPREDFTGRIWWPALLRLRAWTEIVQKVAIVNIVSTHAVTDANTAKLYK